MAASQKPVASVVILAYNDKKYLEACLSSLVDQDMPAEDYEIIYADNASTDGSADYVAEHFPQARVVRFDRNWGFAEGNNRAAAEARGRYVVFQNADTVAHRRWLPELIRVAESDPQVKACHPAGLPLNFGAYHEREALPEVGVMSDLVRYGYIDFTETKLNGNMVPTLHAAGGSVLIDTEIFDDLGYYFDPTFFIYNEDTDLGLRINNLGHTILFVPSAATYHERAPSRRTVLSQKSLRNAFLVTRNRFITFYKNMHGVEYLLALPLICLGSIIKLRTLPLSPLKRVVYALGLIPFTLFSLIMAAIRFPRHAEQRRYILSHSKRGRFWLLKELWKRKLPPATPLYGS
ncbi:MAG: glycosyltransferase family 2 protein [Anaerolineae bacterium]|jgi:GT2 family glycosyltransferase